jgi:hypothetical protein
MPELDHYEKVKKQYDGRLCSLTLQRSQCVGTNLELEYRWLPELTDHEADFVDTRARAYINSAIGFASISQWIGCQLVPNDACLLGVAIPGWLLAGRQQATYVQNSQYDTEQKTIRITVGMRYVDPRQQMHHADHIAQALENSFTTLFKTITV